jgi:catechol 2,3-dioxygenase-like lactoylglutathione lyase family enzyme
MENPTEIPDPAFAPPNQASVAKPALLSHGTMECYSLTESRRFYEEFLGLECVRQGKPAMFVRCGLKFHIVAMQAGRTLKPANLHQHWGLEVGSRAEVDRIHANAIEQKDKYKIGKIFAPAYAHGVYSFYLEDLDHNWWEFLFYDGFQHDDAFDFGDRFPMEENAPVENLVDDPRE